MRVGFFVLAICLMPFVDASGMETTAARQTLPVKQSAGSSALNKMMFNELKKIHTCNNKMKFYVPEDSNADADGCLSAPAVTPAVYDSGWFAAAKGERYTLSHGLGKLPTKFAVYVSPNSSGNPSYLSGYMWSHVKNETGRGVAISLVDETDLRVDVGNSHWCPMLDTWVSTSFSAERTCISSGYVRVVAE